MAEEKHDKLFKYLQEKVKATKELVKYAGDQYEEARELLEEYDINQGGK